MPFYGAAILCLDDENVQQVLPKVRRRTITYGFSSQADLCIVEANCLPFLSEFRLRFRGEDLGMFSVKVPGRHNVWNATAAIAVALELEVPVEQIREGLKTYSGVDRRFQLRGEARGVKVIDDYGHHPTEIRATLGAAKLCQFKKVHVLFQPHRYTRTAALMDEFARSFHQADSVFVLDIYAASEQPIEGISSEALVEKIRGFGHRGAAYAGSMENAIAAVVAVAEEGDAVITLGAGSIWQAGDKVLALLRGEGNHGG